MSERKMPKRARRRIAVTQTTILVSLIARVAGELEATSGNPLPPWTLARLDQVDSGLANVPRDLLTDTQLYEMGFFAACRRLDAARYPFERKLA